MANQQNIGNAFLVIFKFFYTRLSEAITCTIVVPLYKVKSSKAAIRCQHTMHKCNTLRIPFSVFLLKTGKLSNNL